MTLANLSKEALKEQAEASFRKEERSRDGSKPMREYEDEAGAFRKEPHG